jgi:hypothetical protein
MCEVLVIGCGNIGALYDIDKDEILTHVKAFSIDNRFDLTIFDDDSKILKLLNSKYDCKVLSKINNLEDLNKYDIISICTPTNSHYEYLIQTLQSNATLILCEKPISLNLMELDKLRDLYLQSTKKILVNYTRRFQPNYILIKERLINILKNERLTNVSIRYQRGFLNNCSHALDILSFLINLKIDFTKFIKSKLNFDSFELDPTISAIGCQDEINISIIGLANVRFSFFEIDLCFENTKVSLIDSGRDCIVSQSAENKLYFQPLRVNNNQTIRDCLRDQMKFVINSAFQLLTNPELQDNFLESIELNKNMLNFIKK